MNKIRYISLTVLSLLMLIGNTINVFAGIPITYDGKTYNYTAQPIVLKINDTILDQSKLPMQPVIINGTTLVPVREVFEQLGAVVDYKPQSREIFISYNNNLIVMQVGADKYTINGVPYTFSVAPKIINDKTMIPLRAVSEGVGLIVGWDNATREISIYEPSYLEELNKDDDTDANTKPNEIPSDNTDDKEENTLPQNQNVAIDKSSSNFVEINNPTTQTVSLLTNYSSVNINTTLPITNVKKLLLPDNRLVLDIENAKNTLSKEIYVPSNPYFTQIRTSQFQTEPTYITRIVLQLNDNIAFATKLSADRKSIIINFGDENISSSELENNNNDNNTPNVINKNDVYFDNITHSLMISKDIGLNASNIQIDDYEAFNKEILIILEGDYQSYFGQGVMPVNDVYFDRFESALVDGKTIVKAHLKSWGTLSVKEDATHIIIPFTDPHKLYKKIVTIDAGHGGKDSGTSGYGLYEKNLNFTVANRFGEILSNNSDIKIYYTRTSDICLSLAEIGQFATAMSDLLFSVHTNGFSTQTPTGVEVLYLEHQNDSTIGISSESAAKIVNKNLVEYTQMYNRGTKRSQLVIFKNSNIPSVLGEMGFVTNPSDAAKLAKDEFLTSVAQSYAQSTIEIFNIYSPVR